MTVKGHAVRVRTPVQSPTFPLRWTVTTWCGEELQGVYAAFGDKGGSVSCERCREALRGAQAA